MNFTYYLYKEGAGYLTEQGNHTPTIEKAMRFNSYIEAWDYRDYNNLIDYQIQELL